MLSNSSHDPFLPASKTFARKLRTSSALSNPDLTVQNPLLQTLLQPRHILRYRGMAVNDYAFEGRLVDTVVRCSIVLEKTENGWRILHEHLSRTPENFPP
jgi:hypothetical protein